MGEKALSFHVMLPDVGMVEWDVVFLLLTYAKVIRAEPPAFPRAYLDKARAAVRAIKLLQSWRSGCGMPELRGMHCESLVVHACSYTSQPMDCFSIFLRALEVLTRCRSVEQLVNDVLQPHAGIDIIPERVFKKGMYQPTGVRDAKLSVPYGYASGYVARW